MAGVGWDSLAAIAAYHGAQATWPPLLTPSSSSSSIPQLPPPKLNNAHQNIAQAARISCQMIGNVYLLVKWTLLCCTIGCYQYLAVIVCTVAGRRGHTPASYSTQHFAHIHIFHLDMKPKGKDFTLCHQLIWFWLLSEELYWLLKGQNRWDSWDWISLQKNLKINCSTF